jgi:hypothetical protein
MKTDIEYAAMVMGKRLHHWDKQGLFIAVDEAEDDAVCVFEPMHDDGDSRRLEIACRNWVNANKDRITHGLGLIGTVELMRHKMDTTAEQYRAAVFALAVAIGKTIEGNDNAG